MPRQSVKTPQQKKRESYGKDRRNAYGENSKSSRKNIPRSKRAVAAANRIQASQALRQPVSGSDSLESVQNAVESKRPKRWRKSPDVSLKEHLERQKKHREVRSHRKTSRKAGGPSTGK
jgi:hypothetical protein